MVFWVIARAFSSAIISAVLTSRGGDGELVTDPRDKMMSHGASAASLKGFAGKNGTRSEGVLWWAYGETRLIEN